MNLQHPKREPFFEVVLEDGRFAKVRRITRGDWITAFGAANGNLSMAVAIATVLVTTIDGEAMTLDDWLAADTEFTAPIQEAINRMCVTANENPHKAGVA